MLLALDVGNTNTSIGVFEGAELRCEIRLSTARNWTRDEVAVAISQTLALHGLTLSQVRDAVVASVVPPALSPLVAALRHYLRCDPLVVGPGVKTGMPIRYDPPQDVGADRIVSAVAAHHRYGRIDQDDPVGIIVVDFGTATTFDVVSPKPEYLGGAIAPGIGIGADALFTRAARLPRVELARPPQAIGKNTVHALQSGLLYGYVALVEGMIARVGRETTWKNVVVATGGLANLVARETQSIDVVDDNLMLDGLRIIYERNRPGAPPAAVERESAGAP